VGEMGGKIPRQIKEKVTRQWLQGARRATIAKDNGIGEGTVTNIIKDASLQEGYHNMELFRQLALLLNENGLEPIVVGFSLRLLKIMENDGIDINQVEPLISDFATFCFKHKISFDTLIQSEYEALSLEKELGVPIKMLAEHIARAKKNRDDLLDESQKQLILLRSMSSEYQLVLSKVEEHKLKHPLITHKIGLERELDVANEKCEQYELTINDLNTKLSGAKQDILRLEKANAQKEYQLKGALHKLLVCQDKLDKKKKVRNNDENENRR
jgi:hypothetical protein